MTCVDPKCILRGVDEYTRCLDRDGSVWFFFGDSHIYSEKATIQNQLEQWMSQVRQPVDLYVETSVRSDLYPLLPSQYPLEQFRHRWQEALQTGSHPSVPAIRFHWFDLRYYDPTDTGFDGLWCLSTAFLNRSHWSDQVLRSYLLSAQRALHGIRADGRWDLFPVRRWSASSSKVQRLQQFESYWSEATIRSMRGWAQERFDQRLDQLLSEKRWSRPMFWGELANTTVDRLWVSLCSSRPDPLASLLFDMASWEGVMRVDYYTLLQIAQSKAKYKVIYGGYHHMRNLYEANRDRFVETVHLKREATSPHILTDKSLIDFL